MCEQKFFRCAICGNFVGMLNNGNAPMTCCGQEMEEVIANSVEASLEKHIPKVELQDRLVYVEVGAVIHPSTPEHHIEFIYLQTENGGQRKCIGSGNEPKAMFMTLEDKPLEVFAYCNLHGLWKAKITCDCEDDSINEDVAETCTCGCGCENHKEV